MASPAPLEDGTPDEADDARIEELCEELTQAVAALASRIEGTDVEGVEGPIEQIQTTARQIQAASLPTTKVRERAEEAERALADEQRRLEKLWSAYKAQEEEIEQLQEAKREAREALLAERERTSDLERELDALRGSRAQDREEKARLQETLERREERIEEIEPFIELEAEVEGLAVQLEEERARLAKLYAAFEEVDGEREQLEARVQAWEDWADEHADALQGLTDADQIPGPRPDASP